MFWYLTVLFKFTYPLSFFSHELIYIHYVRSINFFGLILQCHNIHTIDFNDIYNLVETCVHTFLKRIVAGLLESANWCILAAWRFFKEVVGKKNQDFMFIRLLNARIWLDVVGTFNQSKSCAEVHRGALLYVLGYHWLPLATIDLVGDNRKFEV